MPSPMSPSTGSPTRRGTPWTTRSLSLALAAAVALLAAGCDDLSSPAGPEGMEPPGPDLSTRDVSEQETPSQTSVAEVVPGFAGYFLADDVPTVYLTDPAERPAAEDALSGWLSSRGFSASDLEVRQAEHDWLQLDAWYQAAWPEALSVDGAVLSDLDEANNRLRFGGVDDATVSLMDAAVAEAGVPSDAYVVEVVSPVEPVATLRDRVRPVPGGYQINFLNAADVVTVSFLCTHGFNAIPEGPEHAPNASFVVNSHCTNTEGDGALDETDYYQPLQDPDGDRIANEENFIGVEVDDPVAQVSPDCPDAIPCRWSDAARAEYAGDVPFELGKIARTASFDRFEGTLEVDEKHPTFAIDDEQPFAVLGEFANKVGRTTGWTGGEIIATCQNILAVGATYVRRCQARVAGGVGGGDSGSPTFLAQNRRSQASGRKVILAGVVWAGTFDGTEFIYSPTFNIERELGLLQTH